MIVRTDLNLKRGVVDPKLVGERLCKFTEPEVVGMPRGHDEMRGH